MKKFQKFSKNIRKINLQQFRIYVNFEKKIQFFEKVNELNGPGKIQFFTNFRKLFEILLEKT